MLTYSVNNEAFKALTFSKEVCKMKKNIENVKQELEEMITGGVSTSTPLEEILEERLTIARAPGLRTLLNELDSLARFYHITVMGGESFADISSLLHKEEELKSLNAFLDKAGENEMILFATKTSKEIQKISFEGRIFLAIPE